MIKNIYFFQKNDHFCAIPGILRKIPKLSNTNLKRRRLNIQFSYHKLGMANFGNLKNVPSSNLDLLFMRTLLILVTILEIVNGIKKIFIQSGIKHGLITL